MIFNNEQHSKFSIDPSGLWSPRQADKVLEVINKEAKALGLRTYHKQFTENSTLVTLEPYDRRLGDRRNTFIIQDHIFIGHGGTVFTHNTIYERDANGNFIKRSKA